MHVRDEVLEDPREEPDAAYADAERLRPLARLGRNLYTGLGKVRSLDRPRGKRP
jgi:hypothetical protein